MKMSEEFPSKYVKASDLQGREVRVTISNVTREELGNDTKPVVYFKGRTKGVVLNKTNATTIGDAYGDDTDDWFGQDIVLFSVMTDFQGKVQPGIRCRVPTAKDNKQPVAQDQRGPAPYQVRENDPITSGPQPRRTGGVADNMNDDIPF